LQHAEAEELTEFGELDGDFSATEADKVRAAVEQIESGVDAMEIPYAQMQERARAALST
jgi:hypothetical protein